MRKQRKPKKIAKKIATTALRALEQPVAIGQKAAHAHRRGHQSWRRIHQLSWRSYFQAQSNGLDRRGQVVRPTRIPKSKLATESITRTTTVEFVEHRGNKAFQ